MSRSGRYTVPIGLIVTGLLFWWFQALNGFNPTDDGFVLAQSWRLLHGQAPHVDFTSPRPLGSAYLHVLDVMPAWGTLAFSRLIVTAQLVWIAYATVDAVPGARVMRPIAKLATVLAAFLVNVGVWPVMAWHTIDGLFLGATVIWLATRSPQRVWVRHAFWALAWVLAGFAPLVKQGFVVVPIALLLVILARREWVAFAWVPVAAVPGALYLLLTLPTPGGLLSQFYSGTSGELLMPLTRLIEALLRPTGIATVVGVVVAALFARWHRLTHPAFRAIAPLVAVAVPIIAGVRQSFNIGGPWAYLAAIATIVAALILVRDWMSGVVAAALLAVAYGGSLSWGAPSPTLLAGSLLATVVVLVARPTSAVAHDFAPSHRDAWPAPTGAIALVALCAVIASASVVVRNANVYLEPPADKLTATIDEPGFALIRTSPQTAAYVESVRACVGDHPPSQVAILYDNPGLYPLLRFHNPFSTDWWLPAELSRDHVDRTQAAIDELSRGGDWLVLIGSINPAHLRTMKSAEITDQTPVTPHELDPGGILERLAGTEVTCRSFVGERSD